MAYDAAWDKHSIKAEIHRRGETLNSLGNLYDLNHGDVSKALNEPFPKAEEVIALFLQVPLWELWPDRYDADGLRIRYIRKPNIGQPLSRATRNRLNQAKRRNAERQSAERSNAVRLEVVQ